MHRRQPFAAAVGGQCKRGALVCGTAQRGALDRRGLRVGGIDLDHPAEAVELVRMPAGVEALLMLVPAVELAIALLHAPALLMRVGLLGALEVVDEVLLAGQVGAPGGGAVAAVVERAQHGAAGRIGGGAHQRMAGGRTGQRHRGGRGDAARVPRRRHHRPGRALALHLDHRHAMCGDRLGDLLGRPGLHAVGMQQAVVDILVVHRQQAACRAVGTAAERDIVDAVVMHAGLQRLFGRGVAGIRAEDGLAGGRADRIAPAVQHRGEADAAAGRCRALTQAGAATQAAVQQQAAGRTRHLVNAGVGAAVGVFHPRKVLGHRVLAVSVAGRQGDATHRGHGS